jgi:hypothetical protein
MHQCALYSPKYGTFVFWKIQQQNVFIKGFSKINFSNKNMPSFFIPVFDFIQHKGFGVKINEKSSIEINRQQLISDG